MFVAYTPEPGPILVRVFLQKKPPKTSVRPSDYSLEECEKQGTLERVLDTRS